MWYHVKVSIARTVDSCYYGVSRYSKAQMKVQPFFSNLQVLPTESSTTIIEHSGFEKVKKGQNDFVNKVFSKKVLSLEIRLNNEEESFEMK